jgi:hypothetical protein
VVSSHKGIIRANVEAEFDKFEGRIDERNEKILGMLETEKTIGQLVEQRPIYKTFPYAEPLLRYWESQMIKKHLEQLEINRKVKKISQDHVYKQTTTNAREVKNHEI